MDESRFGTHSKIGRAWFRKGLRTNILIKMGFKNFYIYSAASPNGENFSLMMDYVDKINMQAFLNEFAKTLNQKVFLIMDNAGWHRNLTVPDKIEIIYLPPYSPELNPVERLWKYMKDKVLKNKVYKQLDDLREVVYEFFGNLTNETVASICTCSYRQL